MSKPRRFRHAFTAMSTTLCLLVASDGSVSAAALDRFSDEFPPNVCLPNLAAPVVFIGAYCDGAVCPPDPMAECDFGSANQPGLPGVYPGLDRIIGVHAFEPSDVVQARIRADLRQLEVTAATSGGHQLQLHYGVQDITQAFDMVARGLTGLTLSLGGDVSPALPVTVVVTLTRLEPVPGGFSSARSFGEAVVTQTGTLELPFTSFYTEPGFSHAAVDWIDILMLDCTSPPDNCPPGNAPPRSYSVSNLTLTTGAPTAANRRSWGQVKSIYR